MTADTKTSDGTRRFIIDSRQKESEVITSFVLRPADGAPPLPHKAGQHLTLWAEIPGAGRLKRNFTISSAPNGATYRISIKREEAGQVSKWLHDHAQPGDALDIAAPAGAFVLPEDTARPIVMVSGGVGLTPMIAMLEEAAARGLATPIHFVHCTHSGATHAFGAHLRELAARLPGLVVSIFYSAPRAEDVAGRDYDRADRPGLEWLARHTPIADAQCYVCGPLPFLRTFVGGLAKAGVSTDRLHYEFFGAVEDLFDEEGSGTESLAGDTSATDAHIAKVASGFSRHEIGDALIDSAADAVIVSDREGLITLWNAGATRIFGFTEEEALGQSLDIIIPEPFRQRHWDGYVETVASGQSRYGAGDLLAVPGLTKDGKRNSLEFTIVLIKEPDGRVKGMAAILRDVTRRFEETRALKKQITALQEATKSTEKA